MQALNHDFKEERPKRYDESGKELIKNKECATCKEMFTCKGKPRGVERCLNYNERKTKES